MANERMVPLLPCASIDEMRDFHRGLGFEVTYRQLRPNPYLCLRREDLELHYFGLDGLRPEESYGSCLVLVDDTEPIFDAFAAGLRAQFGRLPLSGFPRITRPRRRRNAGNLSGFSLVDPSGNWIRVMRQDRSGQAVEASDATGGKLAKALENAIVLADSKGDVDQAARILRGALSRDYQDTTVVERVEALAYLAELSVRLEDLDRARELVSEIDRLELSTVDLETVASALEQAHELGTSLAARSRRDLVCGPSACYDSVTHTH